MNRYEITPEVKAKHLPAVQAFISSIANEDPENYRKHDFSDTELNPFTLLSLLEDLGYKQDDFERNGWQMDFWIPMKKSGCADIRVSGCGITFELRLERGLG